MPRVTNRTATAPSSNSCSTVAFREFLAEALSPHAGNLSMPRNSSNTQDGLATLYAKIANGRQESINSLPITSPDTFVFN